MSCNRLDSVSAVSLDRTAARQNLWHSFAPTSGGAYPPRERRCGSNNRLPDGTHGSQFPGPKSTLTGPTTRHIRISDRRLSVLFPRRPVWGFCRTVRGERRNLAIGLVGRMTKLVNVPTRKRDIIYAETSSCICRAMLRDVLHAAVGLGIVLIFMVQQHRGCSGCRIRLYHKHGQHEVDNGESIAVDGSGNEFTTADSRPPTT